MSPPLAFSSQGQTIATRVDAKIKWRNRARGSQEVELYRDKCYISAIALAAAGDYLAFARGNSVHIRPANGKPKLIGNTCSNVTRLVFSRDRRILAAGLANGVLIWWHLDSHGKKLSEQVVPAHAQATKLVAFAKDSAWLISVAASDIKIWEVASGKQLRQFPPIVSGITAVAITPEGCTLATLSGDQRLSLWSVYSGRRLAVLPGKYCAMAISANGNYIVAARRTAANFPGKMTPELWRLSNQIGLVNVVSHSSCFDFRADISGKSIEQSLESQPRQITQRLFAGQVTATFAVEAYSHFRLWQISSASNSTLSICK